MRSSHSIRPRAGIFLTTAIAAVLFFLALPGGQRVFALDGKRGLSQYSLSIWQTRDGLPQNTIQTLIQTHDGYIWVGTLEGLVRFDGVRFQTFDRRNTPQMLSNVVRALLESRRGELWIGTNAGLLRLLDGQFTAYTTDEGLSHNFVTVLCETGDGSLWVGTAGGGLDRLRDGKFTHYSTREGLSGDYITALHAGEDGSLWVGTTQGLSISRGGGFESYTTATGLANDRVQALCGDGAGGVWVGTDGGLQRLRDGEFTNYTGRDGLADGDIHALLRDREGSLWVGTSNTGVVRFRHGAFTSLTRSDGLSHNLVWSLCEDREGNMWVGTSNGLNRLADGKFTTYGVATGLPAEGVWSIFEDRAGAVWVGTDGGGLSRLESEKFVDVLPRDARLGGGVLSLYEDRAGDLWVGALGALVQVRRGQVFKVYTAREGLGGNSVRAIVGDSAGRLWVGTNGGLNRLEGGRLTRLTTRNGLSHDNVRALHFDRAGDLWIGTIGGGLDRLRDGEFTHYTTAEGLPSNGVRSIFEDEDGTLWIGTDGGLVRLRDGKVTAFTSAVGMFDDTVMGLIEDGDGNFWMASNKGVFRTSKRGLEDFAAGRAARITGEVFGTADGMLSAECNGVSQPSAIRARDGRLWFATVSGAAVVDPSKLGPAPPPPVVIENMVVDDEEVNDAAGRELAPGAQRIEFHYTGLSFVAPERVRFRYRLEGFDRDWVEAGTRRAAYYTNLPPGRYRFQVAAANGDGVWNTENKSIEFGVRPHFFQTRWFYALCAAATLALAWGLYLLHVRRIRQQFALVLAERTRVAREVHDTLIQGVVGSTTLLDAVSGMFSTSPETARQYLDESRSQLRKSLDEARQAVWNMRRQTPGKGDLATALSGVVQRLTAGTHAEGRFKVRGTPRHLSTACEENLLRVGQEAITNAVNHAGPQLIEVELYYDPQFVQLSVEDDGHGFDLEAQNEMSDGNGHHFGLIGMRERAQKIGGQLIVHSAANEGTRVVARVPSS